MLFSTLAEAFKQIEATSSRIQMTARLADLFRRAPEDADVLPYLLQGKLGPPYAAPDIGLDEQRIAQAIGALAEIAGDEVWRLYDQWGDLGLVAEHLLPPSDQPLTVHEVFEQLRRIATAVGTGAYVEKVSLFQDLLRRTGGAGARYLVRIAQGRLRLGVGDATLMDALSVAIAGDTSLRPRIDRAYSFCSDLGFVAGKLLLGGAGALEQIHPSPGRPVLPALAERLPSPAEIIRRLGPVIAEPKYDGLRLQAQKDGDRVWLFTRRLEDVTHAFPEVVRAVRRQIVADQAILDGEAVGYDPRTGQFLPFQQTVRRRRKRRVEEMEILYPLRYYVFDLLYLNGQDFTPVPQRRRSERLREIVREEPDGVISATLQEEIGDAKELEVFVDEMLRRGLEGAVVKRPDAPYHAGARQFNWVKLKRGYKEALADTFDVVVVGYDYGRGKRAKLGIGSLLCTIYSPERDLFRTISRVGSGLTDEEWLRFREMLDAIRTAEKSPRVDSEIVPDVWVEPRYVIEVIAGEITRSPLHTCGKVDGQPGYALRFPRMSRFRFDRRAEDATTENEVIELYQLQSARGARQREARRQKAP